MNLDDVKRELQAQAKRVGCNAVINFTYGQKSATFGIDKMKWEGEGDAAILTEQVIATLLK